jgi:transaldolase
MPELIRLGVDATNPRDNLRSLESLASTGDNALRKLAACGQSCWLDNLSRQMMTDGELSHLVALGVRGVTANPATVAKAIATGADSDTDIRQAAAASRTALEIYEALVTADIREACNILWPVYDESRGADGYVSLEVSPLLADDTDGSIAEARRLWAAVDRPNLFIKIPGTKAGVPAIEELLFEGVNINITLLFSVERYEAVANAYLKALERRLVAGRRVDGIASVASFFLSRIDVLVDELLASRAEAHARELRGEVAIANAKLAYQAMKRVFGTRRWEALQASGAGMQRLLWASTSTKNRDYPDLMYVEPLIGPMTVNTMTEQTIAALLDHGRIAADTVEQGIEDACRIMGDLDRVNIRFADIAEQLEGEGVQKFAEALEQSLTHISQELMEAI